MKLRSAPEPLERYRRSELTVVEPIRQPPVPAVAKAEPPLPRVLLDLGDPTAGPTLLCIAGLHGNEPAGIRALRRLDGKLAALEPELEGRFVALAGNLPALAAGRRFLEADLNRVWPRGPEQPRRGDGSIELGELGKLGRTIDRLRAEAAGPIYCLDLHTTSGPGPAFAVLNDTLPNRAFTLTFPVPVVLGLEEELAGTLAGYLSDLGIKVAAFEAGQHEDPASVERAEDAIWIALGSAGLLDRGRDEISDARRTLARESARLPRLVEVRYRHALSESDSFAIHRGLHGFQPVRRGSELGQDVDGPVRAPERGILLMPLYQELGEEGFFITRRVHPAWLRLSTVMRRLRSERLLHWLPGVTRHPELPDTFVVDRRRARWLANEVFHLLGFRRVEMDSGTLTMTRRLQDEPTHKVG